MPMPYRPLSLSRMLAGTRPPQTGYPKQRRGFVLAKRPDPRAPRAAILNSATPTERVLDRNTA